MALPGRSLNPYAYALNNPLRFVDLSGLDPGDPFDTADEAAIDAIDYINPKSIGAGVEYGGAIYWDAVTRKFSYVEPRTDRKLDSVNTNNCPADKKDVGRYHTHGKTTNYTDEDFSVGDLVQANNRGLPSWLGTPKGAIKKYYPLRPGKLLKTRYGPVETLRSVP